MDCSNVPFFCGLREDQGGKQSEPCVPNSTGLIGLPSPLIPYVNQVFLLRLEQTLANTVP